MSTQNTVDPTRFQQLLERWNSHQQLRSDGAPVAVLAGSRVELDAARTALRTAA
ncbi:MAG: hypothetical protein AAF480_07775 [Actinomycetota bacterium]